jgi:hypothetical protein
VPIAELAPPTPDADDVAASDDDPAAEDLEVDASVPHAARNRRDDKTSLNRRMGSPRAPAGRA